MILLATLTMGGAPDSNTALWVGIVISALVVLILVGAFLSRRSRPRTAADLQKYSRSVFRRAAKSMGLAAAHTAVLEDLVRACKVKQPLLVFSSQSLLDDTLRKGIYSLDNARGMADEERERRKALLFQIKQIIERSARRTVALRSTRMLKPGQLLTITPEGGGQVASKVISNMSDFLTISAPTSSSGTEARWNRGTKVSVYLWRESDAGYSFSSKVLGYDTVKGISCILIQHSKTLRREQRRRAKRREIMRACFFYPIRIVETTEGRKAVRKAVIERQLRCLGTIVDLSAGGCAIQTLNLMDRGKLVMLEFDIDKKAPIRAYGKVMSLHRQKGRGGIMHVMFTNVTRQYLNRICSFVYDFSRPATTDQVRQQIGRSIPGRTDLRSFSGR